MNDVSHISDQDLEGYYLGRIPRPAIAQIEQHLFRCGKCLDNLDAKHRLLNPAKSNRVRPHQDEPIPGESRLTN
jgi:hypothetical protein